MSFRTSAQLTRASGQVEVPGKVLPIDTMVTPKIKSLIPLIIFHNEMSSMIEVISRSSQAMPPTSVKNRNS